MFDEPDDDSSQRPFNPAERAQAKADEFRMHAELAAVFEGVRKFEASLDTHFDASLARQCQQAMGKLDREKITDTPVIGEAGMEQARELLDFSKTHGLSSNDYHVYRRPGEVMIVRWLAGEEVESFYNRMQAHFDAASKGFAEDQRQALEWKHDEKIDAYLAALDKLELKMEDRYLRKQIAEHRFFVLSTQTADEINIQHLAEGIMGISIAELVGEASAPSDEPTEKDLAWYFKLFSLRGIAETQERMCFFVYLQKTDDDSWD